MVRDLGGLSRLVRFLGGFAAATCSKLQKLERLYKTVVYRGEQAAADESQKISSRFSALLALFASRRRGRVEFAERDIRG